MDSLRECLLDGDDHSSRFYALCDKTGPENWPALLELAGHPEPLVRRALAGTLPALTDPPPPEWVELMVQLSRDADPTVRDWACFALAEQWREVDTPALREALADRLDDLDREVRCEALVGLAYRRDERALPRVRAALARPSGKLWKLELEAAGALGDPTLYPLVLNHLGGWDDDEFVDAVRRLVHPNGPGGDLLTSVGNLYRARARHRADPDADLTAWRVMSTILDLCPERAPGYFREVAERLADDPIALDELTHNSVLAELAADIDRLPS